MNQAILFNDDHFFDDVSLNWIFTGLMAGVKITIFIDLGIRGKELTITDCIKFDWEEAVEIWLEQDEPDLNNEIHLKF